MEDPDVIIFPLDFLIQMLTSNISHLADNVITIHPQLLMIRMIIFPIKWKSQFSVIIVINSIAVIHREYRSRVISCILSLHPGSIEHCPDLARIS